MDVKGNADAKSKTKTTPIKPRNRHERRHPEAVPVVAAEPAPIKPIKKLNRAELVGLRAALAVRDEAGQRFNEVTEALREVLISLKLDPDKAYPMNDSGEVFAPQ